MDVVIVGSVFTALTIAIISKLKEQNNPAYRYVKDLIGRKKHDKEIQTAEEKLETKWF